MQLAIARVDEVIETTLLLHHAAGLMRRRRRRWANGRCIQS
jgi:hypothetical protein